MTALLSSAEVSYFPTQQKSHASRRMRRLSARCQGFLEWADGRLGHGRDSEFETPLTMDAVQRHVVKLTHALLTDPACYGQLQGGSRSPRAELDEQHEAPLLSAALSNTALIATSSHDASQCCILPPFAAPSYRGSEWESWCLITERIGDHYLRESSRKRTKRDTSKTYSEGLIEELVDAAIANSTLHRWYASRCSRSNKRHQTFNFLQEIAIAEHAHLLERMISDTRNVTGPFPIVDAVIDFGGGNGLLAFAAGGRLLTRHLVVDQFKPGFCTDITCCAEDPYFGRLTKSIQTISWRHDIVHPPSRCIAISKHLCGSGVDHLLRLFENENAWPAAMALSSCCHHKGLYAEYINAGYLAALGISDQTVFDHIARRCSWLASENPSWMQRVGATCESLLDFGRVLWLRQRGYCAFTVTCMSPFLSPRNRMLVAWKSAGSLAA